MVWNKIFDYFGYIGAVLLAGLGIADYFQPELFPEENPSFFFIIAVFLLMFIFTVKRSRRAFGRADDDHKE